MRRAEKQELYCHACDRYVQFDLDLSVDGDYRLDCPNCGHDHYRVVKKGKITDVRFANYTTIYASSTTSTSTWDSYGGNSVFLYEAWSNTTCTTA
jgi:hypothetical protein